MNIKEQAKQFAIIAHYNQVRKSEPDKPMIIHPIDVANILTKYNFDDNVISAGYLHDIIEDTNYTPKDILTNFNEDILSLVIGATEPNKTLSWEERKQNTITKIKDLDLRHKAVICADKISNLEDMQILFEKENKYDFSNFNKGFSKQKWYFTQIYKSLIHDQDQNHPLFIKLKKLIDYIFNNEKETYIENIIFQNKQEEYNQIKQLHFQKEELKKLKTTFKMPTYVIEFTGTPRTGKTTLINNLYDFFKKGNFNTNIIEELTTSEKYKKNIYPKLNKLPKLTINLEIPKYLSNNLNKELKNNQDIILIDRSLLDRLIWIDRLYQKKEITSLDYKKYQKKYLPKIKNKINIIISTYTDSLTSLKRDYNANLSLEKRNFLNEKNINEYNTSLLNIQKLSQENNLNFHLFDTTDQTERQISIQITNTILKNMREFYLNNIYQEIQNIYNLHH